MPKVQAVYVEIPRTTLSELTEATTAMLYEHARRADLRRGRKPKDFHITRRAMYVARELERVRRAIEEEG